MDNWINLLAFSIFVVLWAGFLVVLLTNRPMLNNFWTRFRSSPLISQLVLALLFLPVVLGLWVWNTRWVVWLRLVLILGLAWFSLYTFFPRLS